MTEKLTRCNGTMTEAQFLSWVRSALRSKSLRWPPRAKALEMARRKYSGPAKQQKWEYKCSICGNWFKLKDVAVDHYPKPAGSILSIADIGQFVDNLYCETSNLRILCHEDHAVWTYSERHKISFEEAKKLKAVIDLLKPANKSKMEAMLKEHNYFCKNPAQRRAALIEILNKEQND